MDPREPPSPGPSLEFYTREYPKIAAQMNAIASPAGSGVTAAKAIIRSASPGSREHMSSDPGDTAPAMDITRKQLSVPGESWANLRRNLKQAHFIKVRMCMHMCSNCLSMHAALHT